MREILFRAKCIERVSNNKWYYGHYVHQYGADMIYLPNGVDGEYGFDCYHIDTETLGQYTGLTDENGKRIFEGDIVYGETSFSDGGVGEVMFCDGLWYVGGEVNNGLNDLTKVYYVEVIGNIHDNPELLKGGAE